MSCLIKRIRVYLIIITEKITKVDNLTNEIVALVHHFQHQVKITFVMTLPTINFSVKVVKMLLREILRKYIFWYLSKIIIENLIFII